MTDSIRSSPDTVRALTQRLSEISSIPEAHLEKDLWVSEALRIMATHSRFRSYDLVFKGGTSLSKAHRMISRFSEDIDLLLVFSDEGIAARETEMKSLLSSVRDELGVELNHDSPRATGKKRGHHRSAEFNWPTTVSISGIESGILIELVVDGGSIPNTVHSLRPLVASLALTAGMPFDYQEAEPFEIVVMDPVRTLVEKLMLVHTAAADSKTGERTKRGAARHYYDIYCLLTFPDVLDALQGQATHLAREIHLHSTDAKRSSRKRPADGFASSPAFDTNATLLTRDEYDTIVMGKGGLVWPTAPLRPTFDECLEQVRAHKGLL